jgi:hypothetical protein
MFRTERGVQRLRFVQRAEEQTRGTLQSQIGIRVAVQIQLAVAFAGPRGFWAHEALGRG